MLASKQLVGPSPLTHSGRCLVRVLVPKARISKQTHFSRPQSRQTVRVEAIGDFFSGLFKPSAGGANSPKRAQLVEELLDISSEKKPDEARISDLVEELKPFGIKRPVRSTQLFGEYQTVFSTNSSKGKLILEQPDVALEISETKSLGFLTATAILSGELNDIDDNTLEIAFSKQETKGGLGGSQKVNSQRRVTIIYLDSDILVTQQQGQGSSGENVIIYSKVKAGEEKGDARQGTSVTGSKKSGTGFLGGQKEGTATIAERTVKRKLAEENAKGSSSKVSQAPSSKGGATAREQLEELAAELKEKQAAARDAAKELKDEERRNATMLRSMNAADAEVAAAAKRVQSAQAQVQDAIKSRAQAEQALKSITAEMAKARSQLK